MCRGLHDRAPANDDNSGMPVVYAPSPMGAVAEPDRTRDEPMSGPDRLGYEAASVTVSAPQTLALLVLALEAAVAVSRRRPA